jgi:hypothetical protein
MKYLKNYKQLNEEINIDLLHIDNKKEKTPNGDIKYSFKLYDYNFQIIFEKYNFIKEYNEYGYTDEITENIICDIWTRDFLTIEKDLKNLNISNVSSVKIYGVINKITEDFINEYSPSILSISHTTESRYKINSLFMDKLNINGYKWVKMTNKMLPNNPKTIIYKKEFEEQIKDYLKQY